MQKIILIITCLCWVMVIKAQPNINRVEYFFNTDPGFGNGVSIAIAPSPNIVNATANINITSVPEGLNSLFVRSRDANGKWSITNRFLFIRTLLPAVNNITGAEYFFDADPGFGGGTVINLTPGLDVPDVSVNTNITNLSLGLHSLFIRSRDASGKWGVTNRFLFVKAASGLPNITATEYFIDTDPGFGNAVPVALNAATNLPDFVVNVNITGLSAAVHRLYLRSRDAAGNWSITNIYSFTIAALAPTPLIAVNSITKKIMCGSTQFNLAYHSTGTYNNGNIFSVQLSNATGSFAAPTVIGSLARTTSGLVTCTIPLQVPNGSNYRVRVVSSNPAVTGVTSDTIFTLFTQPRFSDTAAYIVCVGETVNLNNVFNTTGFTVAWNTANLVTAPAGNYQLITSNTAFCQDTAQVTVSQDVATWTGAVSSDWHNAANWNSGRVPGVKTHVIIPGGTANPCIISTANVQVASIQARNNANVQTTNNRTLEVNGKCPTLPAN
ncbi:MAG: hypothetical protein ABI707_02960 [Ferruginibacter sp.]